MLEAAGPSPSEGGDKARDADRLLLINQILDLSRIETGHLELDRRNFDLRDLVDRTMQIFAVPAHRKGIGLAARIQPDVERWVVGDPDRLRQVLVNLIWNAVRFTTEGDVVVSVRTRPDDSLGGGVRLGFEVSDTGPGISAGRKAAILDRFDRADPAVARDQGGIGVGLTVSMALVRMMGGEMSLESEPGEGCTFHFDAVLERGAAELGERLEPAGELAGLKILIVDDNATNRLILSELILSWGAAPLAVPGGDQAIAELQRAREKGEPYELVLLDEGISTRGAAGVAQAIRADPDLVSLTLMMSPSGAGDPQGRPEAARGAGVGPHLVKPIRRAELLEAILDLLAGPPEPAIAPIHEGVSPFDGTPRSVSILLVDDIADNRMLVEAYLASTDHRVTSVEGGGQAVEAYRGTPGAFDLVLMDIRMPGMDGYEAAGIIRTLEAESKLPPVPIIALTAGAAAEHENTLVAGFDGYLTKPIKKASLLETIQSFSRDRSGLHTTPPTSARDESSFPSTGPIVIPIEPRLERLVPGFLDNRRSDVDRARRALREEDAEVIEGIGHGMRGVGGGYGFDYIATAGTEIEGLARDGRFLEIGRWIDSLADYLDRVDPRVRDEAG